MANVKYIIARETFGTEMAAALIDRYGVDVTVYYSSATDVVFYCAAISDKVIRINCQNVYYGTSDFFTRFYAYLGTAWTSGTTITNPVQFCGDTCTNHDINNTTYSTFITLILGDTLMFGVTNVVQQAFLIGLLTTGQFLCMGFNHRRTYCAASAFLTDGTTGEIIIRTFSSSFNAGGKFVVQPLIFTLTGSVILNLDGSFATLNGVYNAAYSGDLSTDTIFCFSANKYISSGSNALSSTGLFFPLG